ncbi:MAG: C40 family peptidase, partial [Clostridia bacterium]|nr:C40 family peptidase [Clostridia bacterium]
DELVSVLRYGMARAGDDGVVYSGPKPEAYSDATFAQLMQEAEKYIGLPYVWGGSSPSTSFDCSGFVCWAYTHSGVYNLPRTTAQGIYNQCAPISRSEARPGDLVFFTRTYVSSEPVTHIGIYVGDGLMLHCGDPIKYASIDTDYWTSKFYGFGRLS